VTKEKVTFARVMEKIKTENFRVVKVIRRVPQNLYELSDLHDRLIEFQFHNYVLVTHAEMRSK